MAVGALISLFIYFGLMIVIGVYAMRTSTSSSEDYLPGGRTLSPKVAALSAGASDISGWLLLGLPGALYVSGLASAWIGIGLFVGALVNWVLVAPRLREQAVQYDNAMLALIIMPAVVLFGEGGGGYAQASETPNNVDPTLLSWTDGLTVIGWLSAVAWGLGYFGQPHFIVRFMAIRTLKDVPIARNIGMTGMGTSLIGSISLVRNAWAGFVAAFVPLISLSLMWPRTNGAGAMAGLVVGAATVVIWISFGWNAQFMGGPGVYEIIPSFIASWIAIMVASLLTSDTGEFQAISR